MRESRIETLEQLRKDLLNQISALPAFRQGTLASRYRKCGKPNCHCAGDESSGHGPTWNITRKVKGRTVSTYIRTDDIDVIQQQIDTFHRFQQMMSDYVETNIKICDARLEDGKAASRDAEKKG